MKKIVRMLGLCALVALAFTACKKNDTQKVTFTVTATQPTSDIRTHAVNFGEKLVWDSCDQIKVFNLAGESRDFSLPTTGQFGQEVTFNVVEEEKINFLQDLTTDSAYIAFYPNAIIDGDEVKLEIPADQSYVPQRNFAGNLYPMLAYNTADKNFPFVSNAGFLNLSFTCPPNQTVFIDKVVLSSKNLQTDPLTGYMVYDKDGKNYHFVGNGNVITMEFAPRQLDPEQARDFTFVLPEGALHSGFVVDVYYQNTLLRSYEPAAGTNNVINAMAYRVMTSKLINNSPLQIHWSIQ